MSKIEETVAIGNVPAEDELTPESRRGGGGDERPGVASTETKYRVSLADSHKPRFVLNISGEYFKTKCGVLNVIQVLASLTCLLSLAMSGIMYSGHERDDKETWWWRYRLLIFVSIFSFLVSLSSILLRVLGLTQVLPIDWPLFDLVIYVLISIMHLVAGTLVLESNFGFHHSEHGNPHSDWSHKYMAGAVVCSYLCLLLYIASSVVGCVEVREGKRWRERNTPGENAPQRFQLIQQQSNCTVAENA